MERENRPSTADIASEDRGRGPELDEDLRGRARDTAAADEPWAGDGEEPLLGEDAAGEFRSRWQEIQGGFVDEPRRAVQEADALVAELMQRLAQSFSEERSQLESQWDRGDDVSTEDLRVALQRYRSFFGRLLSA